MTNIIIATVLLHSLVELDWQYKLLDIPFGEVILIIQKKKTIQRGFFFFETPVDANVFIPSCYSLLRRHKS